MHTSYFDINNTGFWLVNLISDFLAYIKGSYSMICSSPGVCGVYGGGGGGGGGVSDIKATSSAQAGHTINTFPIKS